AVSEQLVALFLTGGAGTVVGGAAEGPFGIDELHIVSTRFTSMFTQTPIVQQIGPLKNTNNEHSGVAANNVVHPHADGRPLPDYVFEPRAELLLEALLPKYFVTRIYGALLDSAVSELAARRTAMRTATDNANEIALSLGQQINHARQAQITEDLNEIISGADALSADAANEDRP
ncbi:MAG: F0F1 ATP synthase subunit gamma, partial [Mycobacteriaceae bacterium]